MRQASRKEPPRASAVAWFVPAGREGGWQCPLLCCRWPLEGASPGLQVDGCDICGSAGLARPLAAGAPGGFGRWAGGGLGGFPEALPEGSFNLLLTGPQAVLGTRGNGEEGPRPSPHSMWQQVLEDTSQHTGKSGEVRPQPNPRNQLSILRNWQEDVARGCESSPASDTKSPTPTPAHRLARKGYPGTVPFSPPKTLALLQTKEGDKRPQKPQKQGAQNQEWRRGRGATAPSAGGSGNIALPRELRPLAQLPSTHHFSACDPCQQLCELIPRCGAGTQALHCSSNASRGNHGWRVHGKGVILERGGTMRQGWFHG